jgi:cell division septation protein DedD
VSGLDLDFDLAELPEPVRAGADALGHFSKPAMYAAPSRGSTRRGLRRVIAVGAMTLMAGIIVTLSLWAWTSYGARLRATPAEPRSAEARAAQPVAASAPAVPPPATAPAPVAAASSSAPDVLVAALAPQASMRIAGEGATYLIEVATFRRPAGAATLVQQLRALGLTAYDRERDLGARGMMRQVVVGPYDGASAVSALAQVHQIPDYRDAKMRRVQPR